MDEAYEAVNRVSETPKYIKVYKDYKQNEQVSSKCLYIGTWEMLTQYRFRSLKTLAMTESYFPRISKSYSRF